MSWLWRPIEFKRTAKLRLKRLEADGRTTIVDRIGIPQPRGRVSPVSWNHLRAVELWLFAR
jgi:hypothetical protein